MQKKNKYNVCINVPDGKIQFFLMILIVVPVYFELPLLLKIWLKEVPDYTLIFTRIILLYSLVSVFNSATLPVYHAIGKIRFGNTLNGSLMIAVLPVSYFLLKLNFPPPSVFIMMFIVNTCTTIIGLLIIRSYEFFSLLEYLKKVILPGLLILLIGLVVPFSIMLCMKNDSFLRVIILLLLTDTWILFLIYTIGIKASEQKKIIMMIKTRLNGNE
jgi:hypothetical protein